MPYSSSPEPGNRCSEEVKGQLAPEEEDRIEKVLFQTEAAAVWHDPWAPESEVEGRKKEDRQAEGLGPGALGACLLRTDCGRPQGHQGKA